MTGVPIYLETPDVRSDDIALLRKHVNTVAFDYVDVATQEAHDTALKSWPLLAELAAWRKISQLAVDDAGPLSTASIVGEDQ